MKEQIIYSMQREMFRRRYSVRTISSYSYCISKFLDFCGKEKKRITKKDIREFMDMIMDRDYAGNTINVYWNSLKFFIMELLRKNWHFRMNYSRTPKHMPAVLTKEETIRLIDSIDNKKHRLMACLMYSAGLRVSELVNLRARDLEFENNIGWVRQGKGNKDRIFIIAKRLKDDLMRFIKENNIQRDSWLFKGNNGTHLTSRTVQEIVKKARKKSGIGKHVHPHTLRHSFATHLIEDKNDVLSVQSLLGHTSLETTMEYVHMRSPDMIKTKSPFDTL